MTVLLAGHRGVVLGVSGENSIGYRVAARLRALGAEVALTCRPERHDAVTRLSATLGITSVVACEASRLRTALASLDGPLDFVVHTYMHVPSGVLDKPLLELERSSFDTVLDVGVYSLIDALHVLAPRLEKSGCARVVALTSALAERVSPNYHVAGIAKAALNATVRYLAHELGPRGIACNAVSFSLVPTDGAQRAVGADVASSTQRYLAKKSLTRSVLSADDVAGTVAYLVSPLAAQVTGQVLEVDGGYSKAYV